MAQEPENKPDTPNGKSESKRLTWKRVLAWTAFSIAMLFLIVVVLAIEALHSQRIRRALIPVLDQKASEALNVPFALKDFTLEFPKAPNISLIRVNVYGIVVHGAEPFPNPPLAEVEHVKADIGLSLRGRKWRLEDIRVDAPVVHVISGPNGESNLPKLKKTNGGGQTDVFDLGIQHVVLDRGEIYYSDKKVPLDADLHDLTLRVHSAAGRKAFEGTLSYRDGRLRAGSMMAIPHQLDARFEATPGAFHLTHAELDSGRSRFELAATLEDYSNLHAEGHYTAFIDATEMRGILKNSSIPSGRIDASGDFSYQKGPEGTPVLQQLSLHGDLSSASLEVQAGKEAVDLTAIGAQYSLSHGNLSVEPLQARLLGGSIRATVRIQDLGGNSHGSLKAEAKRLSLADLKQAANNPAANHLQFTGLLNTDATATWGKDFQKTLNARANVQIHGGVPGGPTSSSARRMPVNALIHATYTGRDQRLDLHQSHIRTPETTITMNGAIGEHSRLDIGLHSKDLGELETIADAFRNEGAAPLGLGGSASFNGEMTGSAAAPHLQGHFSAHNLEVKGTEWQSLEAGISAGPSGAALQHAVLKPAKQGAIRIHAETGLTRWKLEKTSSIHLDLNATNLSAADMAKLAGLKQKLSGTLAAQVHFDGSQQNPAGEGSVSLTNAEIEGQPIHAVDVHFTAAHENVHTTLAVDLEAGTIHSAADIQLKARTYTAELRSSGIDLSKLALAKARDLHLDGTLQLDGSGQGTFANPEFAATVRIPQLQVQQQTLHGIALQMNLADHVAKATFQAQEGETPLKALATVHLTGDYPMTASFDTAPLPLKPLVAVYAPDRADEVSGETEVHATAKGPLKNMEQMEAHVTIPILQVGYGDKVRVAAESPIHVDFERSVLTIQRTTLKGTDIDLALQGRVPVRGSGPTSLLVQGAINLKIAQLLDPDIRSSGQLKLNINGLANGGSGAEGKIELVNANFVNGNWPVGLEHGNGVFTLTKDRLNIDQLTASVGGGQLSASGGVAYRPQVQFDLAMKADGIRMLYPQGVREDIDADLRFTGAPDDAVLGGKVTLQDLSFTPDFDFMNLVGQFGGVSSPPPQGFVQNLHLQLAVNSAGSFDLVSRTMSVGGAANLQIRGTAAQPVVLGRVDLTGGDVIFQGKRFVISNGTIEFANATETRPVVNLAITTTIQQYAIHMRFRGPVDQMRTNFSSDPSLPEADIINLLAFGQTKEASAANPTPPRQAAMSAVAGQVSSQITSRVSRIAGISQLSIDPVLSGGTRQGPKGAVITIQQRVTGNLFITFSTNVTSTQYQTIMGQYRISPRLSLSGTRDQNGGFGLDVNIRKNW